ncbi:MAG: hypothetical protein DMF58_11995 [Acidobacteria bacterium]|nr:MAG: hypothetical protein DMF58_11995 [Acidobacteriota bacterium]
MLAQIVLATLLARSAGSQPAQMEPAKSRLYELHYTMMLGANHAGMQVSRFENGRWTIDFQFNDRGRGPKVTTQITLNDRCSARMG